RTKYPRCVDGARACPPEDCGGSGGYEHLLEVMHDPTHKDYNELLEWLGEGYETEAFNPKHVRFDNPRKRWEAAFSDY
ncbi:MAG: plasmid pRiA4b ORF-3 family protein, partial [Chloroflexota bacterium]|nr:plasmid pRiA4b ORF-3 family protein [Chloroflexota bacterium]